MVNVSDRWSSITTDYFRYQNVLTNIGVSGEKVSNWATQMATRIAPQYNAAKQRNYLIFGGMGVNDIDQGGTDTQLIADYQTYCAAAISYGFRLVLGTVCVRRNFDAQHLAYIDGINNYLRAHYADQLGAEALADLEADPRLDKNFSSSWVDTYHFSVSGQAVWAELYNAAILKIL